MEELLNAGERKQRIIADIMDFALKLHLNNDWDTTILAAALIYGASLYF